MTEFERIKEPGCIELDFRLFYIKFYFIVWTKHVKKLIYVHTGFDDRHLLWIVNGKLIDLFFIKLHHDN